MRAKEKKDEFNMKLLEGLNIIEKKLIKESGLKNMEVTSLQMRKKRKRTCNNSSPSPVRRYKRYGVDEL
jgi:hypothetical protein